MATSSDSQPSRDALLASEPDRDVGKLVKKWEEYRAEIRMLDNDQVRIA